VLQANVARRECQGDLYRVVRMDASGLTRESYPQAAAAPYQDPAARAWLHRAAV
jgi:hypothetical protein